MGSTLVVMAAGMGSRFGGLKQIEPIGINGEIIADFSVYDAKKAGFNKVVFVIKREMESIFREKFYDRISGVIDARLVYQEIDTSVGRTKPWGTAHAVLCCKDVVTDPFLVVNADDFYGYSAYKVINDYLTVQEADGHNYCMAGYHLKNTVTENGSVSRGVCVVDRNGFLSDINEITKIEKRSDNEIVYATETGDYLPINGDTVVSMNAWGFMPNVFDEIEAGFKQFLEENSKDLAKAEYYLPFMVKDLLKQNKASVKVLKSDGMWYGFTYKEDREAVRQAVERMISEGQYPKKLWA